MSKKGTDMNGKDQYLDPQYSTLTSTFARDAEYIVHLESQRGKTRGLYFQSVISNPNVNPIHSI